MIGCTPKNPPSPSSIESVDTSDITPVSDIDLSSKSQAFKDGFSDGCQSAKGTFTQDSSRFKSNPDYNEGWYAGKKSCSNR